MGFDLVAISGGKALRGPNDTGLLRCTLCGIVNPAPSRYDQKKRRQSGRHDDD